MEILKEPFNWLCGFYLMPACGNDDAGEANCGCDVADPVDGCNFIDDRGCGHDEVCACDDGFNCGCDVFCGLDNIECRHIDDIGCGCDD